MALRKEFIHLLATKVVHELVELETIEIPAGFDLVEPVYQVMEAELNLEDKINDEVRVLLNQYSDHMRQNGISYQEMFKLIKNKLVRERKIIL
jgi:hypothetical protein